MPRSDTSAPRFHGSRPLLSVSTLIRATAPLVEAVRQRKVLRLGLSMHTALAGTVLLLAMHESLPPSETMHDLTFVRSHCASSCSENS